MTATGPATGLEGRLRRVAPPDWFSHEPSEYAADGFEPSLVVSPDSPEAVAAVLADANKAGAAVIPWGGGSHMGLAMPPERYDLALDLTRLDQVIAYESADLTVTVQAGITLAGLQRLLGDHGQWLPLDPPCQPSSTIGGILATNASGPGRIAYGTARDLVIGMTVATVDGQLVKSGGRVVKNVAGYDLAKMHIGALGTLGLITQVSLKVAPKPKSSRTVVISGPDVARLLKIAYAVRDGALPATGIALSMPLGAPDARLHLRFAGVDSAVERSLSEASKLAGASGLSAEQAPDNAWQEIEALRSGGTVVLRASHGPAATAGVVEKLSKLRATLVSYPTAATTYASFLTPALDSAGILERERASIEAAAGALVVEQAPAATKRALGVWGTPRADFALIRALKEQMDPTRTLSPGRFLGGL